MSFSAFVHKRRKRRAAVRRMVVNGRVEAVYRAVIYYDPAVVRVGEIKPGEQERPSAVESFLRNGRGALSSD